jgi:hypothetical protein
MQLSEDYVKWLHVILPVFNLGFLPPVLGSVSFMEEMGSMK